jgi:transposase-like protein
LEKGTLKTTELRYALRRSQKPSREWTDEERDAVVEAVFEGMSEGKTLSETVADYNITEGTMRRWITKDEDLFWEYLAARALMAQSLAEEALRVARGTTNVSASSDRLKIDALQWAATKMNPREFGDKQLIQQEGKQTVEIRVVEEEPVLKALSSSSPKLVAGG